MNSFHSIECVSSSRSLNQLVLNYLTIEGFKSAAETFSQETGLQLPSYIDHITPRMSIRTAIQSGDIDAAIRLLNDLNPDILDDNKPLVFRLCLQKLVEFIRRGEIAEAIEFAQEELAPRGEESPEFLEELERVMALLAFSDDSPVGDVLEVAQRQKLASEVNAAILTSFCQEKDPKLPGLLKMMVWAQQQLDEKIQFPKIRDVVIGKLEEDMQN